MLLVIPAAIIVVVAVVIVLVKKKEKEEAERRQAELRRRQEEERQRQEAERQRQEAERLRMEKAQLEEKQRQQEEKRRQEEAARRAAAQQPPVALNGNAIGNIPATGCIIGRGVECTIALPSDAPGISRQHCKLEVRQGQLFLIDLGSSYGTYYHGQRIAPNTPTPVRVGSTFFLGSERYRFTIG